MIYRIFVTKRAEIDLSNAIEYIDYVLKNPAAADKLLNEIENTISNLSSFPQMHPIIDDPVLKKWELRIVPVGNYLLFYKISNDVIEIVRFVYGKRNWIDVLKLDK